MCEDANDSAPEGVGLQAMALICEVRHQDNALLLNPPASLSGPTSSAIVQARRQPEVASDAGYVACAQLDSQAI